METLTFDDTGKRVKFLEITRDRYAYDVTLLGPTQLLLLLLVHDLQDIEATVQVHLASTGCDARIIGFVIADGSETVKMHTLQHHAAPGTTSNLLIRGVLSGSAHFAYDGAICVDKNAQKTDAYQRNENLLLSPTAHATSSPGLEILANDVRCTHGATIGSVPEDQLWYLSARGIPKEEATGLVVEGFLLSALQDVEDISLRDEVARQVQAAL